MKILELFSGTKSVSKVARQYIHETTSLDLKDADINCNILHWDHTVYDIGYFDFIWASPPCTEYSIAKTTGIRRINEANEIVKKTLEIIDYLKPKYYIIENPQTGFLKQQTFMTNLHYVDVDYCKYGMPYRKRTRLWNNITTFIPKPLCNKDCGNIENNKHIATAQRLTKNTDGTVSKNYEQTELYIIPEELIKEIFDSVS
jgi:site-specific DNA-cytosine methylase